MRLGGSSQQLHDHGVARFNFLITVETRNFLDEICLDSDVESPRWRRDLPSAFLAVHAHSQFYEVARNSGLLDTRTEYELHAFVAQADHCALVSQVALAHDSRPGHAAGIFQNQ